MKKLIKSALKKLCAQANIVYDKNLYNKLFRLYSTTDNSDLKNKLSYILKNINLAYKINRPMCQDTGVVIVFFKIGVNAPAAGINFNKIADEAVKEAYEENFFRKSIVKNALSDRTNTTTNAPAEVYIEFEDSDEIKIDVLIKGAGSENMSALKMFPPSAEKTDIFKFINEVVTKAGEKACPPVVVGVGIGGTMDGAALLSKKSFFEANEPDFCREFLEYAKNENILDIKVCSAASHIASLPVAVSINCHCTRHASCVIKNSSIIFNNNVPEFREAESKNFAKEIFTDDIETLKNLSAGDEILLTGEILTARDAAHKRLYQLMCSKEALPFELKNKIIFYAGPCPAKDGEISGPTGPTTAYRMDKYCDAFYSAGVIATIGKGERSEEAISAIKKYNGKYFTAIGGISCLLAQCVKSSRVIAFDDLGAEAVRKLYVEKFPIKVTY